MLRNHRRPGFAPVAAEVLEVRDLLSSAPIAVHDASHHAAIEQSAEQSAGITPHEKFHGTVQSQMAIQSSPVHAAMHHAAIESPAAKQPPIFQGPAHGTIAISGRPNASFTGTALVPHFQLSVGSKATASFTFSFSDGGTPATIKGTFTGTVRAIVLQLPQTIYGIPATGGKLTLTEKVGGKTIKATATPSIAGMTTDLEDFDSLMINGDFSAKAKGGFAVQHITVGFSPT
jgi:hypothetical protein